MRRAPAPGPSISWCGAAAARAFALVLCAAFVAPGAAGFVASCAPTPVAEGPVMASATPPTSATANSSTPATPSAAATPSTAATPSPPTEPAAPAGTAASASVEPAPSAPAPTACAAIDAPPGYESCEAVELTGDGPCEAICQRARRVSTPNRCCEDPTEVVILSGKKALLRLNACGFVPPSCAHVHGHGNMDAELRVLSGMPPDLVFVEGGCEARAMAHGYVPPGVAAWSGCRHQRYRWDGKRFARVQGPAEKAP